jgi:hypothetical protein
VSATFGESAARCGALAARFLGWRPQEFWTATPAELAMALVAPDGAATPLPPSRETITRMMERDADD